jgi:hypothetical protein
LTAINVRRWSFPVAEVSADGCLSDGGIPSTSGSTVGCIFGLRPQTASGTNRCRGAAEVCRWCCRGDLTSASVGGQWHNGDCFWDACSAATWRERSSIHSSSRAVTSSVEGKLLAVVGLGVSSQIFSAMWEAESRLPSVWPAIMPGTCGCSALVQTVRRKSSGTSGSQAPDVSVAHFLM